MSTFMNDPSNDNLSNNNDLLLTDTLSQDPINPDYSADSGSGTNAIKSFMPHPTVT